MVVTPLSGSAGRGDAEVPHHCPIRRDTDAKQDDQEKVYQDLKLVDAHSLDFDRDNLLAQTMISATIPRSLMKDWP